MFVNQYTVTKQLYTAWAQERRRKGVRKVITILWVCILVILIAAAIIFLASSPGSDSALLMGLSATIGIYSIYHIFFKDKLAASSLYDKMAEQLGQDWTRTVEFRSDAIYIDENSGAFEVSYPYSEIVSVTRRGKTIMLETDKGLILHAYKNKFVKGDYVGFKRFIESKAYGKCELR